MDNFPKYWKSPATREYRARKKPTEHMTGKERSASVCIIHCLAIGLMLFGQSNDREGLRCLKEIQRDYHLICLLLL